MVAVEFKRASTLDNKSLQFFKYNIEQGIIQYMACAGSCPRCTSFASTVLVSLNELRKGKGHGNRFEVGYIIYYVVFLLEICWVCKALSRSEAAYCFPGTTKYGNNLN